MNKYRIEGNEKVNSHHHIIIIIVLIFIAIIGFIIYTSFFNPDLAPSFTGNIIKNSYDKISKNNLENLNEINANLNIPDLFEINTPIEKIKIKTNQPATLLFGDKKIELKEKSSLIIDNFNGLLNIDSKKINSFNGKASKIFVDGLPIIQASGSETKISFEQALEYDYIELENFYLESLNYIASGIIKIDNNKIVIRLDKERIEITNFKGNLKINKNNFELNGLIENSNLNKLIENHPEEVAEEKTS